MDLGLAGKVAIVLGAGTIGNMGQAIARAFVGEGAAVMVAGRKTHVLSSFAEQHGCEWHVCDITAKADVDGLVDATIKRFGKLDIGINCVGYGLMKPFLETTSAELEMMAAVQFTGPFQFLQALVRGMPGGGSIIQITSACLFVASDLCFMTGQTFQVNGGVTLGRNPTKQEMMAAAIAAAS